MTQGRPKGSRAEREVAAMLKAWWSAHEPGVEFVRTPLSGGWSNAKVRGDMRASGDIMTTSKTFPFAVEVKRREGFVWPTFLFGRKSPVWAWWEQTVRAAGEQKGVPMLWARRNDERWRIVLPWDASPLYDVAKLVPRRFVVARRIPAPFGLPDVVVVAAAALLTVPPDRFLPPTRER